MHPVIGRSRAELSYGTFPGDAPLVQSCLELGAHYQIRRRRAFERFFTGGRLVHVVAAAIVFRAISTDIVSSVRE
jgi:hypothetical protein